MYTEEMLKSETYINLYKQFGIKSLGKMTEAEETFKKDVNNNQKITNHNEVITCQGNSILYSNAYHLDNDGTYLNVDAKKTKKMNIVNISLELGIAGFDVATGERYDRKKAMVRYFYDDGRIFIKEIKDEVSFEKQEEEKKEEVIQRVLG